MAVEVQLKITFGLAELVNTNGKQRMRMPSNLKVDEAVFIRKVTA
jgi:hypothetical protein